MSRKSPRHLSDVMLQRGGFRNWSRSLSYLASWLVVSDKLGHPASQDEYVAYWLVSEATNTRDRNAVRACLPEGKDLQWMHDLLWRQLQLRDMNAARVAAALALVPA